ncbi:MAG: DUF3347 domain-containing protein [Ignavibacteriales bacterium]|nr:MAG: DUF3347 domain-containing protein [Ignavibacteriales bacterium]
MKNIFALIVLALIFTVSVAAQDSSDHKHMDMKNTHHDMKSMDKTQQEITRNIDPKTAASIKEIVGYYLQLKDALVNDKSKDAAAAGKEIIDAFEKLDKNFLSPEQKELYVEVEEDAKEMAEHIGDNAGNIEHQREHFDMLSADIYDLVKEFGGGQTLYKIYCSMYNDKKGAIWLSESKTIKNPYYGKKMLTCGTVEEEIK